ncbi:hypothetical protein C1H46_030911 [Malus baccata]|uniref:Uncharacterized protein n=1 Tax=Malus baccata TaxID=106549 RepID=A0A540LAQ1_MALBA|nr:hypothetical protein C1H46_030911 [Malus baccata]
MLHLSPGKALFVFVKNTLPQTAGRLIPSMKPTRRMTVSCICVTAARKPLANLAISSLNHLIASSVSVTCK